MRTSRMAPQSNKRVEKNNDNANPLLGSKMVLLPPTKISEEGAKIAHEKRLNLLGTGKLTIIGRKKPSNRGWVVIVKNIGGIVGKVPFSRLIPAEKADKIWKN